jgi:amidophosphoribosyltransferase
MKFNVIESLVKDKNILIVDDSIVRGTTIKRIVQLVKRCGVKSICIASCAPPVVNINQYGIDIPSQEELIAYNTRNIELELDVQHVYWQDLDKLTKALSTDTIKKFESGCFIGGEAPYPTPTRHLPGGKCAY